MRNFISVFIIIVVVILVINIDIDKNDSFSNNNVDVEKKWDRIASVLENAWDDFGLFSFQATPDSTIFIEMDETKSELQLIKYLEENINKTDLNQFNIEITKKSLHEVETESFMMEVSGIVFDYLQENNYHDVDIYVPSIKPTPILKISIPKSSTRSSENIKKELKDVLASKSAKLPNKDISYEIQVIEHIDESTIESDALISDVVEDFQGTENHLIISDTDIFKGNGIYKMSWAQPSDSKDYKFHITNYTGTNVTVQIQQSSHTQTYNLVANDSTTWVQSAASSGDHTIVVTTSDGRIFKGDVFVSKSDVPLN
ncbi:hypothetical protein [Lysinibacillus sp. ZYM-1]|uniref:hypothetical protein n=1 Tax=Lysinibacillus sp. ZYM-1 TaxID=1681184 RepID=UPI0006CE70B0|nr:hypothetical protein [Lysinibacillus sp. ZYM-1]KPN93072.1 hypothetical protein AO843_23680 [Lysinibacillus sp. ZYM-1]